MATFKNIKGTNVQSIAGDPSNPITGQIWYNSTTRVLRGEVLGDAAWSTSGSLNLARAGGAGSKNGVYTAVVHFGGYTPPGANAKANTEHYDGSSWTNETAMPTSIRNNAGTGIQTAAFCIGGVGNPGASLEYDGSAWTTGGSMSGLTNVPGQATGILTATLAFDTEEAEEYNGTSWTAGGTPSRAVRQGNCAGTQTAAIAYGGEPGPVDTAEFYNGTSWTSAPSLNNIRQNQAGFGTQTSAISAGGGNPTPSGTNITEIYNGSSWSTTSTLNTARGQVEGAGSSVNGMIAGGWVGSPTNATENWQGEAPTSVDIDTD